MNQSARYSLGILAVSLSIGIVLSAAQPALARVGVGMGAGEVRLSQDVKPGGMYTLPKLRIFNTGDEKTTYAMNIAYHAERKELRPGQDWFSFSPSSFTLEAGSSEEIAIILTVPINAVPGDYFAFIESGPVASDKPGTTVGVAVATKLFFTVVPANIFQASYYRITSFFTTYAPWSWVGFGIIIFISAITFLRKFFAFNIAFRKK